MNESTESQTSGWQTGRKGSHIPEVVISNWEVAETSESETGEQETG